MMIFLSLAHIPGRNTDFCSFNALQILQYDTADLAGCTDQHNFLSVKCPQALLSCFDSHGSHGYRCSGQICLCLYFLCCSHCITEQGVKIYPTGSDLMRLLMSTLYLSQDLVFSHHHGIQSCCHMEQMLNGFASLIHTDIVAHLFLHLNSGKFKEQCLHLYKIAARTGMIGIDFGTVTGTDKYALLRYIPRNYLPHQFLLRFHRKCKTSPHFQRSILVTDADQRDIH